MKTPVTYDKADIRISCEGRYFPLPEWIKRLVYLYWLAAIWGEWKWVKA